ncbi:transglycosylase SLT domain-containing protein [Burkholderia multivorans]|uniref:transglycosylase SLT domain-containing protein n=1 Tax=Burkholderia multivorans TaxID=87883 RepID=UPI000D009E19|nr:transglycosylase SLT domain-containing protein [Burkholderia multivorans]PRG18074.1 hypothetical protein C6Q35_27685 [Burkholderia multivorans]
MTRILSTACKRGAVVVAMLAGVCTSARAECWFDAGQRHNIDPLLLYSIAKVESSLKPTAINRNRNGTYDIGLMQINSTHLPRLNKAGITRQQLLNDSCTSVMAGAQILSGFISRHGYTWEAVGAYNAGSAPNRRELRHRYAKKVWHHYTKLKQAAQARRSGAVMTVAGEGH